MLGIYGYGAYGEDWKVVGDGKPGGAAVYGLEDPARSVGGVDYAGIGRIDGEVGDPRAYVVGAAFHPAAAQHAYLPAGGQPHRAGLEDCILYLPQIDALIGIRALEVSPFVGELARLIYLALGLEASLHLALLLGRQMLYVGQGQAAPGLVTLTGSDARTVYDNKRDDNEHRGRHKAHSSACHRGSSSVFVTASCELYHTSARRAAPARGNEAARRWYKWYDMIVSE